jgi:DNA-binding response OmpR family regulator
VRCAKQDDWPYVARVGGIWTARQGTEPIVERLNASAYQYATKTRPRFFDLGELMARVKALFRRELGHNRTAPRPETLQNRGNRGIRMSASSQLADQTQIVSRS